LARELEIKRILVPAQAGVLSAQGMALAGFRRDFSRTLLLSGPRLTWERLQRELYTLRQHALEESAAQGLEVGGLTASGTLELRYPGQNYTLTAPLAPGFREAFHQQHRRLYGHHFPEREPEVVVLRLQVAAPAASGASASWRTVGQRPLSLPREAEVWLPEGLSRVPLRLRSELEAGDALGGPALVLEDFSTLLVLPEFWVEVQAGGHLLLKRTK